MTSPLTRSERLVKALQQLEQFQPALARETVAICVLSGAHVAPVTDPDNIGHGRLSLTFGAGPAVEVIGDLYFRLKVTEAVRIEMDAGDGASLVERRFRGLIGHLSDIYQL